MFCIYILKSSVDGNLYTGYTANLEKRIQEHESGNVESTRSRRPLQLIYYEAYFNKVNALKREKFLKTTKGKQQLRKQLVGMI